MTKLKPNRNRNMTNVSDVKSETKSNETSNEETDSLIEVKPVTVGIIAAINNVTSVIRAFSGSAEQHEILAASLVTIRKHCGF
jgi:hypothetical protein